MFSCGFFNQRLTRVLVASQVEQDSVRWACYMDILCVRYVQQPQDSLQPLAGLHTQPSWLPHREDQDKLSGWCLLVGAALRLASTQLPQHGLTRSLWAVTCRQRGWFLAPQPALLCCALSLCQGKLQQMHCSPQSLQYLSLVVSWSLEHIPARIWLFHLLNSALPDF